MLGGEIKQFITSKQSLPICIMYIYKVKMFFNLFFKKKYTILTLEDIFRLKKNHFQFILSLSEVNQSILAWSVYTYI